MPAPLASVFSSGSHRPQFTVSHGNDTTPRLLEASELDKMAKKALVKVKPFFLYRSRRTLDLSNLTPQSAIKVLAQSPPFSTLGGVDLLSVAAVADLGRYLDGNSPASEIPPGVASFLGMVDRSMLEKFHLLDQPVAAFVMDRRAPDAKKGKLFDTLASLWGSVASLPQLLHSTFCTYNEKSRLGYCMEIGDNSEIRMSVFPKLTKREVDEIITEDFAEFEGEFDDEDVVTSQVLRQAQNRLGRAVSRVEDQAQLLAGDPQAFVDDWDERLDSKIDETQRKLVRAGHRLVLVPSKIDTKIEGAIDEQIRKVAESRLQLGSEDEDERAKYYPSQQIDEATEFYVTLVSKREQKEYQEHEVHRQEISDIVIPLSLLKAGKIVPRPKLFKNVVQQSTELTLKKRQDCVPVTWYNVFHHSIFGDYRFCD